MPSLDRAPGVPVPSGLAGCYLRSSEFPPKVQQLWLVLPAGRPGEVPLSSRNAELEPCWSLGAWQGTRRVTMRHWRYPGPGKTSRRRSGTRGYPDRTASRGGPGLGPAACRIGSIDEHRVACRRCRRRGHDTRLPLGCISDGLAARLLEQPGARVRPAAARGAAAWAADAETESEHVARPRRWGPYPPAAPPRRCPPQNISKASRFRPARTQGFPLPSRRRLAILPFAARGPSRGAPKTPATRQMARPPRRAPAARRAPRRPRG